MLLVAVGRETLSDFAAPPTVMVRVDKQHIDQAFSAMFPRKFRPIPQATAQLQHAIGAVKRIGGRELDGVEEVTHPRHSLAVGSHTLQALVIDALCPLNVGGNIQHWLAQAIALDQHQWN